MIRIVFTLPLIVALACTANRQPNYGNGAANGEGDPAPGSSAQPPSGGSSDMAPDQISSGSGSAAGTPADSDTEPADSASASTTKIPSKKATPASLIVKSGSHFGVKEAKAILSYHNKVRGAVKAAPIYWDVKVAAFAQSWADTLQRRCTMEHRQKNKYGENLWMGTASAYTVVSAAKSWESEKKYYPGGKLNSKNWYKAGHYTQMVWSRSTKLGCGKAVCKGSMIVVCNYSPAGNWMGQKPY